MFEEALSILGLSSNEGKVYEALLMTGETNVTLLAQKSGIHRRSVYDILERLVEKGLVTQIFQDKENMYSAVDPQKCVEILHERQKIFQSAMPAMQKLYSQDISKEAAFIYRGYQGYKNYAQDMLKVAEDTYLIGAKGNWYKSQEDMDARHALLDALKKKNKKMTVIFDPRTREILPHIKDSIGGEYRFFPDTYATPGILDIFGDYVVTFSTSRIGGFDEGSIFVLINPQLADTYRTWFEFMWEMCLPE